MTPARAAEVRITEVTESPTIDDIIAATEAAKAPVKKVMRPILNRRLSGNGYPVRYELKKLGAKWSGFAWYAPLAVADKAQALIDNYREPDFSHLPAWEIPNGHDEY